MADIGVRSGPAAALFIRAMAWRALGPPESDLADELEAMAAEVQRWIEAGVDTRGFSPKDYSEALLRARTAPRCYTCGGSGESPADALEALTRADPPKIRRCLECKGSGKSQRSRATLPR